MNKSKEYIKSESFVVVNPDYPVIAKENALKALAMAEEEMKRKAIEVLSSVLDTGYMVVTQTVSLRSLRKD